MDKLEAKKAIDDLLYEWHSEAKYKVPLGVIDEKVDEKSPYEGIEIAIFFYWSSKRQLLTGKIAGLVNLFELNKKVITHRVLLSMMRDSIGTDLLPEFYNDQHRDFAVDYMSIVGTWKFNYYRDLADLYPSLKTFADIPQDHAEYTRISNILADRLKEYTENP